MAKDKYYFYMDDSGWRYPDREQVVRADGMDYFALGGILVKGSDRDEFLGEYAKFCLKWNIDYPLHSTDIRGKRRNFTWLGDESVNEKFQAELLEFMCKLPVIGFAAVVDRPGYNTRYKEKYAGQPWWMCKTAFAILIERVSKYVQSQEHRFKIIFENCGWKEEDAIVEYFRSLRHEGMPFSAEKSAKYQAGGPELFQQVPYGDPECQTKKSPFLQVADLYLYPMVKGGYEKNYYPFLELMKKEKLIDSFLQADEVESRGIKYSCF